eukprot:jgi/Astpho2/8530/Aster-05565
MAAFKMVLAFVMSLALLNMCTGQWDGSNTAVVDSANGGDNFAGVGGDSFYGGKGGDGTVENSIVKQSANGGNVDVDNGGRRLLWPTETVVKNSANGGDNLAGVGGDSYYGKAGDGTVDNSIVKQSANGGNVDVKNDGAAYIARRHLLWPTETVVKNSANGGENFAGVGGDSYYGKAGDGTVDNSIVKQSANGGNVDVDNGRRLLWPTETVVKHSANGGVNEAGVGGSSFYGGKAGDGTVENSFVKQSANGGNVDVENGDAACIAPVMNSANGGVNEAGVGGSSFYGGKAGDGTVENSFVKQSANGGNVDVEG